MLLEEGVESMGATRRSYDKYGKRVWTSTVKKDTSMKDKSMGAKSPAAPVDSNTTRTDVGIK